MILQCTLVHIAQKLAEMSPFRLRLCGIVIDLIAASLPHETGGQTGRKKASHFYFTFIKDDYGFHKRRVLYCTG